VATTTTRDGHGSVLVENQIKLFFHGSSLHGSKPKGIKEVRASKMVGPPGETNNKKNSMHQIPRSY
jgi:hypothetical protein